MIENTAQTQSFKLKGRLYTLTVLQLLSANQEIFEQQLIETIAKAPKLFEQAAVVFDLSAVAQLDFDLQKFIQIARAQKIIPVAIQGGNALQQTLSQCHQLAILNASSNQDKPLVDKTKKSQAVESNKTKIITSPVRSGQQIVAKGSDLIVTSSVSPGAELLADGSIHVYGALRGRALAGLSGDKNARIFCQSLQAELIAIAGCYRLSDAIERHPGPCQIYLDKDHIQIESL